MANQNIMLPGNPRYQPKALQPFFGYDNLYRWVALIEIATLKSLAQIGVIPVADIDLLTPAVEKAILGITTTEVDAREKITRHDIRAWVDLAKAKMDPRLARWVHIPLTSYDPLDSGRILMYREAYVTAIRPSIHKMLHEMAGLVEAYADDLQIGRTHGQHALPITVGFWLATILNRMAFNYQQLDVAAEALVGKISGAVGASNAIVGLGIAQRSGMVDFESRVLGHLGLSSASISTQILPPEPLAYFLFAAVMLSQSIGQFGRDARHLMRSEIGEFAEPFAAQQSGSSTMAHKRNPITFEGLEGAAVKNLSELQKVMMTLISEHQRDLVASSVMRDFPVILVNLQTQLETLNRESGGVPFLRRVRVFSDALQRNFDQSAHVILSEPLYIALQMAGYQGDAHWLVNQVLTPLAHESGKSLAEILLDVVDEYDGLREALEAIPPAVMELLHHPEDYTGNAAERAVAIAKKVKSTIPVQ